MKYLDWIITDIQFWSVVVFGTAIKMLLNEKHSWLRSIVSAISAIWLASFAAEPTALWLSMKLNMSFSDIRIPVAALYALTGDSLVRWIIVKSNERGFITSLFHRWTGK